MHYQHKNNKKPFFPQWYRREEAFDIIVIIVLLWIIIMNIWILCDDALFQTTIDFYETLCH